MSVTGRKIDRQSLRNHPAVSQGRLKFQARSARVITVTTEYESLTSSYSPS
jgi:hypothetical protein